MVRIRLFGAPEVRQRGHAPRALPGGKTGALLGLLAYRGEWTPRAELVYLLWPEGPEAQARSNLRALLSRSLRSAEFPVPPEIEPTRLRWPVASDLVDFRAALAEARWEDAVALYRGELMAGVSVRGAPEFGAWLEHERAARLLDFLDAGERVAREREARGRFDAADRMHRALLEARPEDEDRFRSYLRFLERSGRGAHAETALERFRAALARAVDAEPDPATVRLAERVAAGRAAHAQRPAPTPHNLPAELTPFVGRRGELADAARRLHEPACRCLTLLAPGGMGKSRLALACAAELLPRYPGGVWFVPLDAARDAADVAVRIAEACGARFRGSDPLERQLAAHFGARSTLLLLDGAELALAAVPMLAALLRAAPGVDLLVTSRERLRLSGERVMALDGLALPAERAPLAEVAAADAVRLFAQRSRGGDPVAEDPEALRRVAEICRRLGGMPLAIELAAGWSRVLTPAAILDELRGDGDLLRGEAARDAPERQRSVAAVFDASWRRLRAPEQRALARSVVFREGFDRDAAREVAEIGLPVLAALVDKALLRVAPGGRYRRHPLLRQYLEARFGASDAATALRERHAEHYLAALDAPPAPLAEDLENLAAAWRWAAAARPDALRGRAQRLMRAFEARTATAIELLQSALEPPHALDAELESELLCALTPGLMTTLGFASPRLHHTAERLDALVAAGAPSGAFELPAAWCSWMIRFHRADVEGTTRSLERLSAVAAARRDPDAELQARHAAWTTAFAHGDYPATLRHAEIDHVYDPERHRRHIFLYGGHDAKVCATTFVALAQWLLGRASTSLACSREGYELAERLEHPFTRALVASYRALLHGLRRESDACRPHAVLARELGERHGFALGVALGRLCEGWSEEDPAAGCAEADAALEYWRDKPRDFNYPAALALRAELRIRAGRPDDARTDLDAALVAGAAHRRPFYRAELLRLRAELRLPSDVRAAREGFREAFEVAAERGARALQLRALCSLARHAPEAADRRALEGFLDAMPEPPAPSDLAAARAALGAR